MNMKKLISKIGAAAVGTFCMAFAFGISTNAANASETTMAATTYLNVRSGAGTNTSVIGVLSPNEAVKVTGITNGWYHVEYKGQSGYAYQQYLNFEGSSADGDVENGKETDMVSTANLNVRSQPGTNARIIGSLTPGEKIQVTGKNNGWYKVKYNGQNAYVYGHYLTFIGAESAGATTSSGFEVRNMTTTAGVNFRQGPSTNSAIIGSFAKGTVVKAVGAETGWFKVEHNGQTGYVSDGYLVDGNVSYSEEGATKTTTANVNMRTSGSKNARVILTIPAGSKVKVLSSENGWDIVEYNGQSGAVYAQYLR